MFPFRISRRGAVRRPRRGAVPARFPIEVEALETRFLPTGSVSGLVFRDYDADGTRDAREPGVGGLTVTAYDPANAVAATATTSAAAATLGQYTLDLSASAATRFRVEFTGLPTYLESGAAGPQSGTSVQFADTSGGAATANFSVNNPADYSQELAQLQLIAACYVTGNQLLNADGTPNTADVLVSFPADARGNTVTPTHLASANQVGTVYGLAYQRSTQTVYAAALMKRHSGFGPGGTGALYRIDLTANPPTVTTLVDLSTLGIATGADPHPTANGTYDPNQANGGGSPWFRDITPGDADGSRAFDAVGKVAFGDMDISEDGRALYVVNLATRELIEVPLTAGGQFDAAAGVRRTAVPLTTANDPRNRNNPQDVRPFGLGVKDGIVYVGSVYTAQTEADGAADPRGFRDRMRAFVYTYNPALPDGQRFGATPVLEFALDYARGSGDIVGSVPSLQDPRADWLPWTDTFTPLGTSFPPDFLQVYPQPVLSDIAFDNGDMIVGFRDRTGDQGGYFAGSPNPADATLYTIISAGDTLRAAGTGNGTWTLESNGTSGGVTSGGANTGAGPGGGEFYYNDQVIRDTTQAGQPAEAFGHQEITLGSVVQVPGVAQAVVSGYDAYAGFTGAALWFNNVATANGGAGLNRDGDVTVTQRPLPRGVTPTYTIGANGPGDRYQIFATAGAGGGLANPPIVSKASGLGDFDATFNVAPLEIGNRVWHDLNANGRQDANEPGLAGVLVRLLDANNVQVAQEATDALGQFVFTDADVAGGLVRNATYRVAIGTAQAPLTGFTLTGANAAGNDAIDSDAALSGADAVVPVATTTDGRNNHTFDVGFFAAAAGLSLGNRVFLDANNNGLLDATEAGIQGVTVNLYRDSNGDGTPDGAAIGTTTTNATGHYLFTGLTAGTYVVEAVTPAGFTTSTGTVGSATGPYEPAPDPDNNIDSDDNGTAAAAVVRSGPVTLAAGTEPTGEAPSTGLTDPAADADSNLTVDFGFFRPMRLGNLVFDDLDNDGQRDVGEPGIGNVTVRLLDAAGTTTLATTTTAADGTYGFNNLPPGSYVVEAVRPAGYVSSTGAPSLTAGPFEPAPDPDNDVDNDDNGTTTGDAVRSLAVTLVLDGEPTNDGDDANGNLTVDFGVFRPASLCGNVTYDANRNRVRDPSESPIPGVLITLRDSNGAVVATTTTDANGDYCFRNLLPGTYAVFETQPATYDDGADRLGSQGGTLGEDQMTDVVLPAGVDAVNYDFLEVRGGVLTDREPPPPPPPPPVVSKISLLASTLGTARVEAATRYVQHLFVDLLGRQPDENGLALWVGTLLGGASRADVARAIWNTTESRSLRLDPLYRQVLRRSPDDAGRQHFLDRLAQGATEAEIAVDLLTSAEYLAAHPDAETFLSGLYNDVLGRALDDGARAFWLPQLADPANLANVARGVVTSAESSARVVGQWYGNYLHRAGAAAGVQFYVDQLITGRASFTDVAVALLASDEYFRRA